MTLKPAGADEGVVFVRKDIPGENRIKADIKNVTDTTLATTLGMNGTRVSTVEHLLSAFRGVGVDNAVVEIDSYEVPIMDGSALPFVDLLKLCGTRVQNRGRRFMIIKKEVSVSDKEGEAALLPSSEFQITYRMGYDHPVIGDQACHMVFSYPAYEQEICAARTFGFLRDVEYLQAKGLALGGSLNNAIVLDEKKIINKEGLRFPDELIKHKILDAIGDLFLLGMPIIGHFVGNKSGHRLNTLLRKELMARQDSWKGVNHFDGEKRASGTDDFPLRHEARNAGRL